MGYIDDAATVMEPVKLGANVTIGKGAVVYPNAEIGDNVYIGPYCIVGEPTMDYYRSENHAFLTVRIGKDSIIRSHTVIYEDVAVGESFQTGHHVTIREGSRIGNFCSVGTLSDLQGKLEIGNYVRLHSNVMINQFTRIEDYVWMYPRSMTTNDQYPPMGNLIGAHIRQYAQIGAGAVILPGKVVGENALVGAGSVVTKDVPAETLAAGNPARSKGSVRDVRDGKGNPTYPWKEYLAENRGYPWQKQ